MMFSVGSRFAFARLADDHAAARQALADIVVGVADQVERHAAREERAEAPPAMPVKRD